MKRKIKNTMGVDRLLFTFPYFYKTPHFFAVYLIKTLLVCLLCGSAMVYAATELNIGVNITALFFFSVVVCTISALLFTAFNENIVVLVVLIGSILLILINQDMLTQSVKLFINKMTCIANDVPLDSIAAFPLSYEEHYLAKQVDIIYPIAAFLSFFCSTFVITNYGVHYFAAGFAVILTIPAFISGNASFDFSLVLFIASFAAMEVFLASYNAEGRLNGTTKKKNQLQKELKKANGVTFVGNLRYLKATIYEYGKYLSNAVTMFVAVLLTLCITVLAVPQDAAMNPQQLLDALADTANNVGDFFGDLFGLSTIDSNGFFTADGAEDINISNEINIGNPSNGKSQILNVTLDIPSDKLYLRGDIGYEFTGNSWKSISAFDYSDYNYVSGSLTDALSSYSTDLGYRNFRQYAAVLGDFADSYFGVQTVKIDYLKKTNVLLMPLAPLELNFRDNENYNCTGDFVTNTLGKRWISSFETVALYPKLSHDMTDYSNVLSSVETADMVLKLPIDEIDYYNGTSAYEQFITDVYTAVPNSEEKNITRFLTQHSSLISDVRWENCTFDYERCFYAASIAESICNYFHENFKYSLTADNTSDSNTKLGNFLFDTKSGHCALYASAMTLMMRSLGYPARYVTGYVVGGEGDEYKITENGYEFPVYENNLHAWVEVWLDGVGWMPFDPTPAAETIGGSSAIVTEHTTAVTTTPPVVTTARPHEVTTERTPSGEDITTSMRPDTSASGTNGFPTVLITILIVVAAAAAATILLWSLWKLNKRLERNEKNAMAYYKSTEPLTATRQMLRFMLRLLSIYGMRKASSEAPLEFARRVDREVKLDFKITCESIMPIFEKVEFDNAEKLTITDDERRVVYLYIKKITSYVVGSNKNTVKRWIMRYRLFRKINIRKGI